MMHVRLLATTLGLFILLGLTYASSSVPLGIGNFLLSSGIAVAKAGLVAGVFMQLGRRAMSRTVLMTAVLCLMTLYSLTVSEIWTRPDVAAPRGHDASGR